MIQLFAVWPEFMVPTVLQLKTKCGKSDCGKTNREKSESLIINFDRLVTESRSEDCSLPFKFSRKYSPKQL